MRDSTPSTSLMRPPVGNASGALHSGQLMGTLECEKALVTFIHEAQRSDTNSDRGFGMSVFFLHVMFSCWIDG